VLRGARRAGLLYRRGFHGDEVNGIEVRPASPAPRSRRAQRTVLMVPAQNPLALQAQHRVFIGHYLKSPLDQSPTIPGFVSRRCRRQHGGGSWRTRCSIG